MIIVVVVVVVVEGKVQTEQIEDSPKDTYVMLVSLRRRHLVVSHKDVGLWALVHSVRAYPGRQVSLLNNNTKIRRKNVLVDPDVSAQEYNNHSHYDNKTDRSNQTEHEERSVLLSNDDILPTYYCHHYCAMRISSTLVVSNRCLQYRT